MLWTFFYPGKVLLSDSDLYNHTGSVRAIDNRLINPPSSVDTCGAIHPTAGSLLTLCTERACFIIQDISAETLWRQTAGLEWPIMSVYLPSRHSCDQTE